MHLHDNNRKPDYIIYSVSLNVSLERNANLVVACMYDVLLRIGVVVGRQ